MASKKEPQQQNPRSRPNKKYFNYCKKDHYARYCSSCTNPKKAKRRENGTRSKTYKKKEESNSDKQSYYYQVKRLNKKPDNDLYLIKGVFMD